MEGLKLLHFWVACHTPSMEHGKNVGFKLILPIHFLHHLQSHCLSIQISLNTMAGSKHFHFWSGCHTPSMEHGKNVGFKLILPIHFLHHLQSHCLSNLI